ncbi:hypothetical protein HN451_01610 [archaeon]|jgi:putative phosphoesterase|nr:hypothetical protein [archaeon]
MKIFTISDLHYNTDNHRRLSNLASYLFANAKKSDVLLLLGDYGNNVNDIQKCLTLFLNFPGKKLAIMGNHDLWEYENPNTPKRVISLMSLFERLGFHSLDREPVVINDIGFTGSIGWYDYSFLHEKDNIDLIQYMYKIYPGEEYPAWKDAIYCNWNTSDVSIVNCLLEKLMMHLNSLRGIEKVFVGMHHVPTNRLLFQPRFLLPKKWRFLNAFLGSNKFSELINTYTNVSTVLCGHIHRRKVVDFLGKKYISLGDSSDKCDMSVHDVDTDTYKFVSF